MLGSANLTGGPLFHILSGNLSHQIEHHLFPDIPARRYAEIAEEVQGDLRALRACPTTPARCHASSARCSARSSRLALPGSRGGTAAAHEAESKPGAIAASADGRAGTARGRTAAPSRRGRSKPTKSRAGKAHAGAKPARVAATTRRSASKAVAAKPGRARAAAKNGAKAASSRAAKPTPHEARGRA